MVHMKMYVSRLMQVISEKLNFKNNNAMVKKVLIVGGALLLLFAVFRNALFSNKPKLDPVILSFQGTSLSPGTPVKVFVDTKSYEIGFIRVTVKFDNEKIELIDEVTIDPKFATLIQKSTQDEANANGEIVIAAGLKPGDSNQSGNLEIASLPFAKKDKAAGETTLQFITFQSQVVNMKAQELPLEKKDLTIPLQ